MNADIETSEIIKVLNELPQEKVSEVRDFAVFLHSQYVRSQIVDESDEWSDEDLRDFASSSRFVEMSIK
jgi:hypothetical protein